MPPDASLWDGLEEMLLVNRNSKPCLSFSSEMASIIGHRSQNGWAPNDCFQMRRRMDGDRFDFLRRDMSKDQDMLADAIARNSAMVLSLPSAGMLRHHKSRFLSQEDGNFWVESAPDDRKLIDELINSQQPVGVSFKAQNKTVAFAVPIVSRNGEFRVNAETTLEALLLKYPENIKAIQRRNNYRVSIIKGTELSARVWRIPEHVYLKDRPLAAAELSVQVRDLSLGGMGVNVLPKNNEPPKIVAGERLRIQLAYNGEDMLIEGRMLHSKPTGKPEPIRGGIQFKKLEHDIEGRQTLATLTKIVGELQREEVRRTRLGISAA
jgi:c-di-GMP-binding flagellar brake protein YcgR